MEKQGEKCKEKVRSIVVEEVGVVPKYWGTEMYITNSSE